MPLPATPVVKREAVPPIVKRDALLLAPPVVKQDAVMPASPVVKQEAPKSRAAMQQGILKMEPGNLY